MQRGARSAAGADAGADFKTSPVARHYGIMAARHGFEMSPPTRPDLRRRGPRAHGGTARPRPQLAAVGAKNHRHSVNNPYARFQDPYGRRDLAAKAIHTPLTKLQCSPTPDGAAAAVVVSERFVEERGLGRRPSRSSPRR